MASQLVVANAPNQARQALRGALGALQLGAGGSLGLLDRAVRHWRRRRQRPTASQPPSPLPAPPVQDLAKTNRVFVHPDEPVAALQFVQMGDL